MEQEREIIVVGAGPAGATAATILAQQGHDVLLLDRHQFPRDKTCGDAIPAGATEILIRLGMQQKILQAVTRGEFYPLQQMRIVSPKGYFLQTQFQRGEGGVDSYVAPRLYFDAMIQQHAVESGAHFCQAQVKEAVIENGRVVGVQAQTNGKNQEIRAKLVLAADGVTSVISRTLQNHSGIKTEKLKDIHRAVALRAYIEDLDEFPGEVEFYLYKGITPGYAWIFPIGENRANIGLGMRLDKFKKQDKSLKELLKFFLEIPLIKKRLQRGGVLRDVATWQLNFGSQRNIRRAYEGALLLGDAGSLINPLTGGGIHNAIISAELAAETAHEALINNDFSLKALQIYDKRCYETMWDGMRRSFWLNTWLMQFPSLIDFLIHRMKGNSQLAKTFLSKL